MKHVKTKSKVNTVSEMVKSASKKLTLKDIDINTLETLSLDLPILDIPAESESRAIQYQIKITY